MKYFIKSQYNMAMDQVSATRNLKLMDYKALLESLHINNDVNSQVKLFSMLSTFIVSNEVDIEVIITFNSLYDQICQVLSNCPPRKGVIMFNFLSILLYAVDEDSCKGKTLARYARNMIRSSGSLATMCELFTSSMMCVQRCCQRNIEVFLILQSLLQNHVRNINLFIECSGISLFQREFLQHDVCLQLLNTLMQSSTQALELIKNTDVCENLYDFLRLYGPQTQLGQWATIILYRISGLKGTSRSPTADNQTHSSDTLNRVIDKTFVENNDLQCTANTTRFFQNVMREIINCPQTNSKRIVPNAPTKLLNEHRSHAYSTRDLFYNQLHRRQISPKQDITVNFIKNDFPTSEIKREGRPKNNLSFSFLQQANIKRYSNIAKNHITIDRFRKNSKTSFINITNSRKSSDKCNSLANNGNMSRERSPELINFQPKCVSTPKKHIDVNSNSKSRYLHNMSYKSMTNSITKQTSDKIQKRIPRRKKLQENRIEKEIKHRSISGWFFEAINESCTTLVKTVKNIFKPKNNSGNTRTKSSSGKSDKDSSSRSYSFTNYMRQRDTILQNENIKISSFGSNGLNSEISNSCNTCNDTIALKLKFGNDEYLKQTVRKLKLGINLYGCDFKKISKQLWPCQTYMTPTVLYNLYRKLIIK